MKKLLSVVVLASLIGGCGPSEESEAAAECKVKKANNTYDRIGTYGLIMKPATDLYTTFETIDSIYAQAVACVAPNYGVVEGPTVEFVSFKNDPRLAGAIGAPWGVYMASSKTIMINTDEDEIIKRNCISDEETARHEFVHHVLFMVGENWAHGHPAFERCGMGVNTSNGVPVR